MPDEENRMIRSRLPYNSVRCRLQPASGLTVCAVMGSCVSLSSINMNKSTDTSGRIQHGIALVLGLALDRFGPATPSSYIFNILLPSAAARSGHSVRENEVWSLCFIEAPIFWRIHPPQRLLVDEISRLPVDGVHFTKYLRLTCDKWH